MNLPTRSAAANVTRSKPKTREPLEDHRLFQILSVSKTKTSPPLWMHDGCFDASTVATIQAWHRAIAKTSDASDASELAFDVAQTIAQIVARLETDSGLVGEKVTQSRLDAVAIGIAAAYCCEPCKRDLPDSEFANFQSDLWTIVSFAESASSIDQLLTKTMGIELGATLCVALNQPDEAINRFIAQEFEAIVEEKFDGDGWPDADLLADFGMTAGSLVRAYKMLVACEVEVEPEIGLQMEWLVRQAIRMRRNGHRLSFTKSPLEKSGAKAFWQSLLSVSEDDDDRKLWRVSSSAKSNHPSERRITPLEANKISEPYNISEWGKSAILRSTWSPKSPKLAIDFSNASDAEDTERPQLRLDLGRSQELIFGDTMPTILFDGCAATPSGDAEVVCERCDDDLDYLEIQIDVGSAGRLNRQFLLSRTDEFLLVIDSVIPSDPKKQTEIDYRCELPLAEGIEGMHESETSEVYLQTTQSPRKIQSLVLPLSLPEWKVAKFDGKLSVESDRLILTQQQTGFGLCVPFVFDLNPKRSRKKRTWRQLSVLQDRQPVPRDHGCAFRFQLDKSQWFFYRGVATLGNRTFLGQNSISEFVFFKFNKDGSVDELIDVK